MKKSLGREIGKMATTKARGVVGGAGIGRLRANTAGHEEDVTAPSIGSTRALSKSPIVAGSLGLVNRSTGARNVGGTDYAENASAGSFTNLTIPSGTSLRAYYSYHGAYSASGGGAGGGGGGIVIDQGGEGVAVVPLLNTSLSMSNLGGGPTEGDVGKRVSVDLRNAPAMRLVGGVATPGSAGSAYAVQYSVDDGATWAYVDGASGPHIEVSGPTGWRRGAWADVAPAARGEVVLRVIGRGGDGVADPNVYPLFVYVIQGTKGVRARGTWSPSETYIADDLATHEGSVWRALRTSTNVAPVEGADWTVFAARGAQGIQGVQGEQGVPGLRWRDDVNGGDWDPATAYALDDAVFYGGSSFRALGPSTGAVPTDSPLDWKHVARKGDTGATGPMGPPGGVNSVNGLQGDLTAQHVLDAVKSADGSGTGLDADLLDGQDASAFAAASHVGSRAGHPLATATLDGLMAGIDKAKLDGVEAGALKRPSRIIAAPVYATNPYTISGVLANTWTRMRLGTQYDPNISIPILGAPPPGTTWKIRIGGAIRFTPPAAGTIYFGAGIGTAWAMNANLGSDHRAFATNETFAQVLDGVIDVADPTVAFTVTFALFGPAGDYVIRAAPNPYAEVFLAAT